MKDLLQQIEECEQCIYFAFYEADKHSECGIMYENEDTAEHKIIPDNISMPEWCPLPDSE